MENISKIIGLFVTVGTFFWGAYTFIQSADKEREVFTFNSYHKIIADIYDGGIKEYQGSQRALIYELSNFPEYKTFTCRELPRMKETYSRATESKTRVERVTFNESVIKEIQLTFNNLECGK